MADKTDAVTLWKDSNNGDRVKDDSGCSEIEEACNCKGAVWLCGYGDTPTISQADLSKWVGNSMTDCGIQFGNADDGNYDGMWGIQIWKVSPLDIRDAMVLDR